MLVLSRRAEQCIVFPNIDVTLKVLSVRGNVVKVGINAPRDIKIVREELADVSASAEQQAVHLPKEFRHAVRNRLNSMALALQLLERQIEAGDRDDAHSTFLTLLNELSRLDGEFGGKSGSRPQPSSPSPAAEPVPEKPAAAQPEKCKALVIDDDANERELLAGFLRYSGCHVATAGDGVDALEFLTNNPRPDFVLLDMKMPRCDGPQTLKLIRQNPDFDDLRVFAVSGTPPESYGLQIGPGGLDRWYSKPLNPESLVREIVEA